MVAGARLAIEAGWEVRGSDNPLYPPTSEMVKALDVPVYEGYAATNLDWNPDVVVIGNALSRGNDEVEAILDRGLKYVSFPEWIKEALLRDRKPVVITGTHGKTTTTAINAHVFQECGLTPGYLIGGQPLGFPHSATIGEVGAPFAIEGDEYDTAFFDKRAKFFHYLPYIAVVTSLEYDHADIYESIEAIELAFQRMLRQIPQSGHLILCGDDELVLALREYAHCTVHTYGSSEGNDWVLKSVTVSDDRQVCEVVHDGESWGTFESQLIGEHNMKNCLTAIITAILFGIEKEAIQSSLASFAGIKRRLEIFHTAGDTIFLDDFAHHPTAIKETIKGVKARWPEKRLTVFFEPRSNTTATNLFQNELGESFDGADEVWIGPIFRPEKYTPHTILDREELRSDLIAKGIYANTGKPEDIVAHLKRTLDEQEIVLMCSNGAFGDIYKMIRDKLS
jgi:UDP-N-acetylmuramate: L-alanyl-gamma-D-glutamyl-meso-diaminopimelate ligase